MKIFSVKDNKAETFGTPFFQQSEVQAVRVFKTEINRAAADNLLYQHPDDFDLYQLGVWDDQGRLAPLEKPLLLLTGRTAQAPAPSST